MNSDTQQPHDGDQSPSLPQEPQKTKSKRVNFFFGAMRRTRTQESETSASSSVTMKEKKSSRERATLGILTDHETDEVPGTVMLLSPTRNEPLGMENMEHHREDDARSIQREREEAKRTRDGKIVLNPQPEDTPNDPLNWPAWRRDCALLALGFYCMLGGGMTPILAAGFNQVATTYDVSYSKVALTTGLYMMGLGVGSVIFSPTAILFGKRTVYLASAVLFVLSAVWCALSPNYASLVVARIFQGIAVSPVECLPSATIAEIFFLHERAYRVGIYTLLLLGGKNLIPLISAAIIQAKGWRWVFWIIAIAVGFGGILLFFFNPETFWDRTPRPRKRNLTSTSRLSLSSRISHAVRPAISRKDSEKKGEKQEQLHVHHSVSTNSPVLRRSHEAIHPSAPPSPSAIRSPKNAGVHFDENMPHLHDVNANGHDVEKVAPTSDTASSPTIEKHGQLDQVKTNEEGSHNIQESTPGVVTPCPESILSPARTEPDTTLHALSEVDLQMMRYTSGLRRSPPVPYMKTLKPYNGRLSQANWFLVACRPFILYAYPSVLWASMVYALSVGWLIVLSESVAHIYQNRETYNFSSIGTGLVYISPFVGGVLGTAVAGRFSDVIVRYMARRNGGIYEPEFRLVMAIPIGLCTAIGLMGFGWSAEEKDKWIVPTVFFGIISFGCCMGSTTAITFCVDSYRQFAAEALVTLNFSKNVLHGLVFSLFFPQWLEAQGSKDVFLAIGGIQIACMLLTIPMYIYGKRARMWTVRKKMMEKF